MRLVNAIQAPVRRAGLEARSVVALARAGMIGLEPPRKLAAGIAALRDFGAFGGVPTTAALRHGDCPAIADERGEISFNQLEGQVNRLVDALRDKGLQAGSTIGILCQNHRGPLIVAFAASRLGASAIWLNTSFSAPQAREVADREGVELLVYDAALAEVAAEIRPVHGRYVTAADSPAADELDKLIASGRPVTPPAPDRPGRIVLLTSGTTGTPKGAPRADPRSLTIPGALLERMPMRAREATVVGPPLYHGTGLAIALLSLGLGSKLVLRRRFAASQFLDDIERHGATGACVVPIMLQRVLALGEDEVRRRDLSSLRVVFCAGSQLPAEVALRSMDLLGDVIYNLYGSTEVSVTTLATPADIRAAPTSVGRAALGSRIRLLDEHDRDVPTGRTGRIFVASTSPFEGYTGGGGKQIVDGFLSTGDLGHFDQNARLYIDGRDDEMIVSGGENVFPREVEELLVTHPSIVDAAVVGVDDAEFGQRLKAFVVAGPGATITAADVQELVKQKLARYKVPREVEFLDDLPRNPTGKILKRVLVAESTPPAAGQ